MADSATFEFDCVCVEGRDFDCCSLLLKVKISMGGGNLFRLAAMLTAVLNRKQTGIIITY